MSDLFAYERLRDSAEELLSELRKLPRIEELLKVEEAAIKSFVFAEQKVRELSND